MSALADRLVDSAEDGRRLVGWAAPNSIALEEPWVFGAAQAALGRTSRGERPGDLMLRPYREAAAPRSLLQAVTDERPLRTTRCDRCDTKAEAPHRLWVPMGPTVVEIVVCRFHREVLTDSFNQIVWR